MRRGVSVGRADGIADRAAGFLWQLVCRCVGRTPLVGKPPVADEGDAVESRNGRTTGVVGGIDALPLNTPSPRWRLGLVPLRFHFVSLSLRLSVSSPPLRPFFPPYHPP